MLSPIIISLLGFASLALTQTANIDFYTDDNVCLTGLFETCVGLRPNVCCALASNQRATCMDFITDTPSAIAAAFSSQGGNQCALIIVLLESGVCVCPTGSPVISGGSWGGSGRDQDDFNETCEETIGPNAFGWKENNLTWMVYEEDGATYTNVAEAIANGTSNSDIGKFIKKHGQQV